MWRVTVDDVRDLASSRGPDATDPLKTIYGWRYDQLVARARAVSGFGAGLLATILVGIAVPSGNDPVVWVIAVPALIASVGLVAAGLYLHVTAARVQREYIVALALLAQMRPAARP